MKYGIFILMLAIAWIPAWGQNVDEFQFVSVMYPAVAAFNTIDVYNKTTFGHQGQTNNVYVNIGSKVANGGTINIEGDPIEVATLELAEGTGFDVTGPNWFVKELKLHSGATVTVGTLIANQVSLDNHENFDTTLDVTGGQIRIDGDAYTTTGRAVRHLKAQGREGGNSIFEFVHSDGDLDDKLSDTATWNEIKTQDGEDAKTAKADTHYPIYK